MLERIISIENVGVFKSAVQKVSTLKKLALIYADNARGKSTLSSVLLACANTDADELKSRKTFGSTADQKVVMRFPPLGRRPSMLSFQRRAGLGPSPIYTSSIRPSLRETSTLRVKSCRSSASRS